MLWLFSEKAREKREAKKARQEYQRGYRIYYERVKNGELPENLELELERHSGIDNHPYDKGAYQALFDHNLNK